MSSGRINVFEVACHRQVGKSVSTERQINILLVVLFSLDLLTIRKSAEYQGFYFKNNF